MPLGHQAADQLRDGVVALADTYSLRAPVPDRLARLLRLLAGSEDAPTTVREPRQALDIHVADSLVALELEQVRTARVLVDIGSGAGFPGLALALALPACRVHLVESSSRKCAFLTRMAETVPVDNATIVPLRVEEYASAQCARGMHDVVTARALAPATVVLEYAAPLLADRGLLVDWRGARDAAGELAALRACEELGLRRLEIRHVTPYADARQHHLHLYLKVRETPDRYPRRAGIARKRPLGG